MKKFRIIPLLLCLTLLFGIAAPRACALDDPQPQAEAVLLVDLASGDILYAKNIDQQRSPASLTKIMTGLLAVEAVKSGQASMDDIVTAGPDCQQGLDSDSSNASIVSGEEMTLRDYLNCALIASANEACNVIGTYLSGSISAFVDRMNERAAELGCTGTHFADPNGLSSENHYTTAYDLYLITRAALQYPEFAEICNTVDCHIDATNANGERNLTNSNALLSDHGFYGPGYVYDGAAGVKTGYTRAAGYCLISTAERDNVRVMAIVLGCSGPNNSDSVTIGSFTDSRMLYDWVFDNFSYQQVLTAADPLSKVNVDRAAEDGVAILRAAGDVSLLLPNDVDLSQKELQITVYEDKLVAPIAAGTALGEVIIEVGGKQYGPVSLVTNADIDMSKSQFIKDNLHEFFSRGWVRTVIVILVVCLLAYIILVARYRALRRKHLKARRRAEKQRRLAQEQRARTAVSDPTQRFQTIDPAEREVDLGELSKYFDQTDKKE